MLNSAESPRPLDVRQSSSGVLKIMCICSRVSGRTITQAEWVKELKRVSNLWLKREYALSDFEWQLGYADFSVSQSNLEQVTKYIANQEEHHRRVSFQDEVRSLLSKHQMEWDERYIWE